MLCFGRMPVLIMPDTAASQRKPNPDPARPSSPPTTSWLTGCEVAELLTITRAPVANYRRNASVSRQVPGLKSDRKSAAQAERERLNRLWHAVAAKMAGKGYTVGRPGTAATPSGT
jgi:glutathione S-transferase